MKTIPTLIVAATIPASQEEVWKAWTTSEGVKSFLAPDCLIDFRIGGAYEIYFDPDAAAEDRGSIGSVILAIQPIQSFSFTWRNPPSLTVVRWQFTHVQIQIERVAEQQCEVVLSQDGWGSSPDWEKAYQYFERAWQKVVMPHLVKRFTDGPINWDEIS
jgi:uncharacterized protein YndB with AHSA1/START domain